MAFPVPSEIKKTYPARGPLQQYRFATATAFECMRCQTAKKSKLITIYNSDWNSRLCNGCYGRLLSIFEIKAGSRPDDEKAEELANILLSTLSDQQTQQAIALLKIREQRVSWLTVGAERFLATSEFVAKSLRHSKNLDWSPAIIGLCKAVETELVDRLVTPLLELRENPLIDNDLRDKDFGRFAKYVRDGTGKPPELGTFAHFLQTIANSKRRRANSMFIQAFLKSLVDMPGSSWILDINGLHKNLDSLTKEFRNRSAHLDDLGAEEYEECRELVIGEDGLIWNLVYSTTPRK